MMGTFVLRAIVQSDLLSYNYGGSVSQWSGEWSTISVWSGVWSSVRSGVSSGDWSGQWRSSITDWSGSIRDSYWCPDGFNDWADGSIGVSFDGAVGKVSTKTVVLDDCTI